MLGKKACRRRVGALILQTEVTALASGKSSINNQRGQVRDKYPQVKVCNTMSSLHYDSVHIQYNEVGEYLYQSLCCQELTDELNKVYNIFYKVK